MAKVILISQYQLPYPGIGSWTKLYANYLTSNGHKIDYIVCPEPKTLFESVEYSFVKQTFLTRLQNKFGDKTYAAYFSALKKIFRSDEDYVIQIVDNQGIVKHLDAFLKKNYNRNKFYLQYFNHGFGAFLNNAKGGPFYKSIDELVLLTYDSYKFYKNYFAVLPVKISVLHNGVDTKKFYKADVATKQRLKESLAVADKKVFIWCSQDRPKKGLKIVLEAWRIIYQTRNDIVLLVAGGTREPAAGVQFLGPVPNDELVKYYQAADVYLFPTLWHEGFGMSLIEALHCGNYCIASALGGVPEVLQYGKLGVLIENPHFVDAWVSAIRQYLENPVSFDMPPELYSTNSWNDAMNKIISDAADFK